MLADKKLKAFVPTIKPAEARSFYGEMLGLKLLSEDNDALEFDANGTLLRVTMVPGLKPQAFYCPRLECFDIISVIKSLNKKGIVCGKYAFLEQDEFGVWSSPGGSKVAWFKDPDGNILSLTQ